jgi:hypothetical protein
MSHKQIVTPADHPVVKPARIQYLRTGSRRPAAPKVGIVSGVQPFLT